LVEEFSAILAETKADPNRILLEITETSLMADVEGNLRVLRRLAELGLSVAVDDFGTGYSSLAQLTRLPVSVLKIDRALVDGLDKSEEARAVIRAVIGLGRSLGLKLVAEGVETSTQQLELCAYGCDLIQGYFFHRPLDEPKFIQTIAEQPRNEGPNALHTLIYVSRARQPMTTDALAELREQSAAANRSAGVSGCLLYRDGHFMQLLEGQRDHVMALYEKSAATPAIRIAGWSWNRRSPHGLSEIGAWSCRTWPQRWRNVLRNSTGTSPSSTSPKTPASATTSSRPTPTA
jgi:hypothetical protein